MKCRHFLLISVLPVLIEIPVYGNSNKASNQSNPTYNYSGTWNYYPKGNQQSSDAQNHAHDANAISGPTSQPTATSLSTAQSNQSKAGQTPWYGLAFGPATWPTWALVILAGIAAWIGVRTLGAINEQTQATVVAAKAASDNAAAAAEYSKIAALALRENRPLLLVKQAQLKFDDIDIEDNGDDGFDCVTGPIIITFENYGANAALLKKVIGACEIVQITGANMTELEHQNHHFGSCTPARFKQHLVVRGQPFSVEIDGIDVEAEDLERLVMKNREASPDQQLLLHMVEEPIERYVNPEMVPEPRIGLVVYGKAIYTDVFGRDEYITHYCLHLSFIETSRETHEYGIKVNVKSESWLGPKSHNQRT